jgi:hypothetical protein
MTHVFVHYHLRTGGVNRVLHAEADYFAQQDYPFAILSSGLPPNETWPFFPSLTLDYSGDQKHDLAELHRCFEKVRQSIAEPIVWHIHNPTLGCHPVFSKCLHQLFETNERLIFHIHDFAEDHRPNNLRALADTTHLYPFTQRTHYVVLSSRDRDILLQAGLPERQISIIPNPVVPHALAASLRSIARIVCPVRGIDRKNLGEMVLLAALDPSSEWATTLAPGKSLHQKNYPHWKRWAQQWALPIEWEIAEKNNELRNLTEIISDCTHILSTSQQEGFGMSFLESIAWQRPMLGRAIPHIQKDLAQQDIFHPFLYDRIFSAKNPALDFCQMSLSAQEAMIKEAIETPENIMVEQQGKITPAASWLHAALENRQAVSLERLSHYSPSFHGEMLRRIDEMLMTQAASPIRYLNADVVRKAFSHENSSLLDQA